MKFFVLESVSLLRKYIGLFDFLFSLHKEFVYVNLNMVRSYQSMKIHESWLKANKWTEKEITVRTQKLLQEACDYWQIP